MNRKRIQFKPDKIPQVIARIKSKVKTPKGEEGCWAWIGAAHRGQALMHIDGSYYNVRRVVAYTMLGIDVEKCRFIYTTCGNPLCVNPAHLVPIMEGPLKNSKYGIKKVLQSRTKKNRETDCSEWTGNILLSGYGSMWINGKLYLAHRLSAMVHLDFDIESDLCVLHKCDNPRCTNPDHLRIGTREDNMRDMYSKERQAILKGEAASGAKITTDDVLNIRKERSEGKTTVVLSKEYGVTAQQISQICNGKKWSHLPGAIPSKQRKIYTIDEELHIYSRWKKGESQRKLAKDLGICQARVWKICHKVSHSHTIAKKTG